MSGNIEGKIVPAVAHPAAAGAAQIEADRHPWRILATLSALLGFASISTDFYLPAMPTMPRSLGASPGAMGWTISAYLVGFSLGQLVWGPIGDRYGRRLPVAVGLILFIVGSAGCGLSTNATMIIYCRVVQAIGACAGVVLARAMIRDLYEGDRAAQMLSTLMTVMAIAPCSARRSAARFSGLPGGAPSSERWSSWGF
jgi:DHA1 family bicyclomycin/chloramphenicol resistance-like MFS transporter